jgi:peptidoglycan/xylan/chitin deacetylase (PgdA/CDA1 family)
MDFRISVDDGDVDDLRSAELLENYGLTATFYIPNTTSLGDEGIIELGQRHTLGGHTVTHPPDIKRLLPSELVYDIQENKKWLESFAPRRGVASFCYPRGRHNESVRDAVREAGYREARTTLVNFTDIPDDPFRTWTSCHAAPRKEYAGQDWLTVAKALFRLAQDKGARGYFHLWWHSHEIRKHNDWKKLEELLFFLDENRNAWEK